MNELKDFFKLMAEGKKNTPTARAKKIEEQVRENVKSDFSTLLSELSSLKKQKQELVEQNPELLEQHEEISEQVITEVAPLSTPIGHVPPEQQLEPESNPALDMDEIGKYLSASAPKEEGDNPLSEYAIINKKIKFLEQWVGKIQNTGPGSGEVNFRYLDDVNRGTMNPGNDNWVLEYDSATKKVQFTENVGPIRTVKFNTEGYQTPLIAGQMGWNPIEDCLDIAQADGTTLQTGLEHYFQIHNTTGTTLTNGEVVMFSGVDEEFQTNPIPNVSRYSANSTAVPLYIVGVVTTEVADSGIGRATVFGKVRGVNTTGSTVGETWAKGDLLWAHPTQAGKLTNVRPTAPNVATSIAAVLQVGSTDGILLVRPTIWPRLFYGDWYDITNQTAALPNTAYAVKLGQSGDISGFDINAGRTEIKALNAGRYNFEFSLQITSSNSALARVWIWYRKNGVDVPNSATVVTVSENGGKLAPAWNFPVLMNANDTFTLMWATESTNVSIAHEAAQSFCPAIPSVILTVAQTNL